MATRTSSYSSSTQLLHHLLRHPKQPSSVCLSFRPFCVSKLTHKANQRLEPRFRCLLPSLNSTSPPPSCSSISVSRSLSNLFVTKSVSSVHEPQLGEDEEYENNVSLTSPSEENSEDDEEHEEANDDGLESTLLSLVESDDLEISEGVPETSSGHKEERTAKPRNLALNLSVKEKKELASYAHSLGKKLKCQLVGKSGVTDTVVSSFVETLEKNELLKVKIHRTCPGELEVVVQHLEEATGSVVVGQIGRTVIVYRPSLTKMRAEEKRKEAQRMSMRRTPKFSPASSKTEYAARSSGRGRRGVSRVATS